MKQAVIMFPFSKEDKRQISEGLEDSYQFHFCEEELSEELLDEAEVIVGQPSVSIVKRAKRLRWVQGTFAGVDGYLKHGDFPKEIILTNVTGAFGESIAEYMLAVLLSLYKKLPGYTIAQKSENWKDLGTENSIFGKRVLIIGAGDIGTAFARLLVPFHTATVGIRRTHTEKEACFQEMYAMKGRSEEMITEQLAKADIVAMCLPSTKETRGYMDYKKLSCMKENSLLINVGRGDTIVTEDLIKILEERPQMQAALDVVNPEPLPKNNPLWQMEQVLLTPHISGGSFGHLKSTTDRIIAICRENLKRYSEGSEMMNVIDKDAGYAVKK